MSENIVYVGLDVDDTQYHGAAVDKSTGEILHFSCRPTAKGLLSQLQKLGKHFKGVSFRLCYEASYIGFTLQRDMTEAGYPCEVVAPTSIPSPRGRQVKTDRLDAGQLAQFFANGLLTMVSVPERALEEDRDLLRTRQHLLQQQVELRRHMQSLLRRHGLHYKAETQNKSHWTKHHVGWLERTIEGLSGTLKLNLALLLRQVKSVTSLIAEYDQQIEVLAHSARYQKPVQALVCYKGIKAIAR